MPSIRRIFGILSKFEVLLLNYVIRYQSHSPSVSKVEAIVFTLQVSGTFNVKFTVIATVTNFPSHVKRN